MKKVIKLYYNWRQVNDGYQQGDDYNIFEVGKNGVIEIIENEPHNGMQLWNYEIHFENGESQRIFNPNHVFYSVD